MIYSVHGYYRKLNSRKQPSKIETIVFASSSELAQELVERLFDGYPADLYGFSVVGGLERNLQVIYEQRPDLKGIDPDRGYVYNHASLSTSIYRYFK